MSQRRSRSDENSNNTSDPNSLTVFQRLWCVAHTLSWLNVPELAHSRRVNSTFLEAVDCGYVAQPFIHLVQTVERLQSAPAEEWTPWGHAMLPGKHSDSWLMRMLQNLSPKLPFQVNSEFLDQFDHVVESGDRFLCSVLDRAVSHEDYADLDTIFGELGASKKGHSGLFESATADLEMTEHLADLGLVDRRPNRTLGFALHHEASPTLVRKLLEKSKCNAAEYKKIGKPFNASHDDSDESTYEYQDFDTEGFPAGPFKYNSYRDPPRRGHDRDWTFDTIASAAVRRCAYTFRRCGRGSKQRKEALANLRLVIEFERDAPWRTEWHEEPTEQQPASKHEEFVSPIHLAAANRDYEALELILNCGFALGGGAGVNAPGLAGRYISKTPSEYRQCERGYLTQLHRTALEHVCFEWTRYKNKFFQFDDNKLDAPNVVIPVIKLLFQHGAKWSGWYTDDLSPKDIIYYMPNPAIIVSRDPSEAEFVVKLVKEHGCRINAEADNYWFLKPWNVEDDRQLNSAWFHWEYGNDSEFEREEDIAARQNETVQSGETILSNAIKSGQVEFVKTVVLELGAALELPLKVVRGTLNGHWDDESQRNYESDKTMFCQLKKSDEQRMYTFDRDQYRGPAVVDATTGRQLIVYNVQSRGEKRHRFFLTQAWDLDPTPEKLVHLWLRAHCDGLAMPDYEEWLETEECEEAEFDEEEDGDDDGCYSSSSSDDDDDGAGDDEEAEEALEVYYDLDE